MHNCCATCCANRVCKRPKQLNSYPSTVASTCTISKVFRFQDSVDFVVSSVKDLAPESKKSCRILKSEGLEILTRLFGYEFSYLDTFWVVCNRYASLQQKASSTTDCYKLSGEENSSKLRPAAQSAKLHDMFFVGFDVTLFPFAFHGAPCK